MKRPVPHALPSEREIRQRRKKAEASEVRLFTERSRRKRRILLTWVGSVVGIVGIVAGIVLSPLLTLTTIDVVGNKNLPTKTVTAAVKDQLGVPLALINFDKIRSELAKIPRIESFTTELVPPHTLIVRVVERKSIGLVKKGKLFQLVDSAGIVIADTDKRPEKLPLMKVASTDDPNFANIVDVLLSLTPNLRSRIDVIAADSHDSVRFTMKGSRNEIIWGSPEQSDLKSVVLSSAIKAVSSQGGNFTIDVSAPDSLVISPRR